MTNSKIKPINIGEIRRRLIRLIETADAQTIVILYASARRRIKRK